MNHPPHLQAPLFRKNDVAHGFFGRLGGLSAGPWYSLNCNPASADQPKAVTENLARCCTALGATSLAMLKQVHSAKAVFVRTSTMSRPEADALVTDQPALALAILTADCMPVLFHDPQAKIIGAAHAGWRGALGGVLEQCVALMVNKGAQPHHIRAVFGPCLQQDNFEVGPDLITEFSNTYPQIEQFIQPSETLGKHQLNLRAFGQWRLANQGLLPSHISHLPPCTMAAPQDWFSYRQMKKTGSITDGRNLSAITLK